MEREEILETDVFDLLDQIPYIPSKEELAVEDCILSYERNKIKLDEASVEALSMMLQDIYVGDVMEKVRGAALSTGVHLKKAANTMATFMRYLQRISINHIVNEKFIRKRFDGLKTKYVNLFYQGLADTRSYVEAPTYDDISKRLTGIHNCVMYLKRAAMSANIADSVTTDTYARLVSMSNGALSVKSSANGIINNLVWNPPAIVKYKLSSSPWAKPENIDNMCNSVLFVRYKTMEGVNDIVKQCMKNTKMLVDKADDLASYDIEDETAEQYMQNYGSAYMMSKMLKDIVKQGIQREINTLAINYIHKLKVIKTEA